MPSNKTDGPSHDTLRRNIADSACALAEAKNGESEAAIPDTTESDIFKFACPDGKAKKIKGHKFPRGCASSLFSIQFSISAPAMEGRSKRVFGATEGCHDEQVASSGLRSQAWRDCASMGYYPGGRGRALMRQGLHRIHQKQQMLIPTLDPAIFVEEGV